MTDAPFPPATAFAAGCAAFRTGQDEKANPFVGRAYTFVGRFETEVFDLGKEWMRGYRNTRKYARFQATIGARRLSVLAATAEKVK